MNIYGVKFTDNGKVYYFNGHNLKLNKNINVIVETEKGLQYGKVIDKIPDEELRDVQEPFRDIIRATTKEDYKQYMKNLKDAEIALHNAQKISNDLGLEMHFLTSSYTFDRKQLLFNFSADERVDFRELTKRLAGIYRTRIELRQIGARDKACSIGGIGQCGRTLCCSTFLKNLESVSMNMAKNQNLALNPSKINGCCGRLLCCLAYEDEAYQNAQKGLPSVGSNVSYDDIKGKVTSVDILNRKVKVDVGNEIVEVDLSNESN
jgi:cell fate regulator YaaT (PSP1 superfamily)